MKLAADLHIHTVLSPCAAPEMTPAAIVREAERKELSVIAICDHNSAGNTAAVQRASVHGLLVVAGIEITTKEEAHLVGLFPDAGAAREAGETVLATLPELPERLPGWMGEQQLMTHRDQVRGHETRMLASACALSLQQAVDLIHQCGGIAVAAHVDRPSFSVLSQLGMIPDGLALDALDVSPAGVQLGRHHALHCAHLPILSSSDAHSLEEVGAGRVWVNVENLTFSELCFAIAGKEGRGCSLA